MIHQIGWTLPRWRTLVAAPLAARGTSAVTALAAFALFGAMYVIHTFAQVPQACLPQCAHCGLCASAMPCGLLLPPTQLQLLMVLHWCNVIGENIP